MDKIEEEIQYAKPYANQYQATDTKRDSGKKSKTSIVIVFVIVIAVVLFSVIILFVEPPPLQISSIHVSLSESFSDHLDVTVLLGSTSRSSLAGNGDLEITYNDNVIYDSEISIDEDGTGELDLPYNSFLEGNGNYHFQVNYKGAESLPELYSVSYLVESLSIGTEVGAVSDSGQLNITTIMLSGDGRTMDSDPKDAEYLVTEIRNLDDNLEITTANTPSNIDGGFVREGYPYLRSGNYSISVKVTNNRAKITSNYYEINETRQIFLNIFPVAKGAVSSTELNGTNYTANFDASSSWNDGDITLYIWDFNNDGIVDLETTKSYASYSGYVNGMNYNAVLNVQGDVIVDSNFNSVEKGAIRIPVNSP